MGACPLTGDTGESGRGEDGPDCSDRGSGPRPGVERRWEGGGAQHLLSIPDTLLLAPQLRR